MPTSRFTHRLTPAQSKEIALQTLAAQLSYELHFSGNRIYCSSEFHYKTFSSYEEAEQFLISERFKRQPFHLK
ncbi:MAG: hypothetical protein D0433_03495 [Candidatus Thermochlorobacter aerophilum]|jgi:hypothetical protein|uniref:Uncharacterized protein n=1 Tax=Candidatus Thermochlorobacter aerophilus TaxID=1868324 RepID=A0A395M4K2_9BACT|nr:MAG: hypothetical protein D0433_03495 [Candidatus Thermochlorobacter aerophilum]